MTAELSPVDAPVIDDQIDPIAERAREAIAVPLHLQRRATAFVRGVASIERSVTAGSAAGMGAVECPRRAVSLHLSG